eukprot:13965658-Ditylum_brightwellii.AAC.1
MDDFTKSKHKSELKEPMFENYEKMNIFGTFSAPFLRCDLPSATKNLKAQTAFKIKLQEEEHNYELYTWTAANN